MRPLRVKASGSPPSSSNFQGLQEMTDTEINQYLSYVITNKYADDWDGTLTGDLNMDTANALSGSAIGTFADTKRTEAIGTHPATGALSTTTYYFKQVTSAASESITNRALGYDTNSLNEFTDAELDTDILDKVITDMVTETDYTVGQFHLAASAPSGGTWTSRYTITDTQVDGDINTTYLWQKTTPTTSANSDLASLTYDSGVKMMTAAQIEQMVPNFRNRIVEDYATTPGVGCYLVQSGTPSETGTWTQMGDTAGFTDTRHQMSNTNYAGSFGGSFANTFSGDFTGSFANTFSGDFANTFSGDFTGSFTGPKTYTGAYSGAYSGDYSGNFIGTADYSGAYTGIYSQAFTPFFSGFAGPTDYTGAYTGSFTGFFTGPKTYTGSYSGEYGGTFTGDFVGTSAYSGTYTGAYGSSFSGTYTGAFSGAYTGAYSSLFSGTYTGLYSGQTIQATTENVSTIKLWLRTA